MSQDLYNSLVLMGEGMAGIFIVLIVIAIIVSLLARFTTPKKNKTENEE